MAGAGSVTVIIPALNEEERLGICLDTLRRFSPPWEVIVVDGGSSDRTAAIAAAAESPRVRVLTAPRGRGQQLNAGALAAAGDVLLFLHADVTLPDDAPAWIERALADPLAVGGAFRTRHVADGGAGGPSAFLRLADLRSRYTRLPYGDQAVFARAEVIRRLGGVPEIPLMEDLELARRLRRAGGMRTVPASVRVSSRRFIARPIRSALCMNLLPLLYRLGVSPRILARLYGDPR